MVEAYRRNPDKIVPWKDLSLQTAQLRTGAAHVDLQFSENVLGDLRDAGGGEKEVGESLVRLLGQTEKLDQSLIGLRGDSRLDRATQVERDPVGLAPVERVEHPLP